MFFWGAGGFINNPPSLDCSISVLGSPGAIMPKFEFKHLFGVSLNSSKTVAPPKKFSVFYECGASYKCVPAAGLRMSGGSSQCEVNNRAIGVCA